MHGLDDFVGVVLEDALLGTKKVVFISISGDLVVDTEAGLVVEQKSGEGFLALGTRQARKDLGADVSLTIVSLVVNANVDDLNFRGCHMFLRE